MGHRWFTGDPLHSRALAHSRAPLFTQPCSHCSHSPAPGEQWARLCVFTLHGSVQAARLCRGSPVWFTSSKTRWQLQQVSQYWFSTVVRYLLIERSYWSFHFTLTLSLDMNVCDEYELSAVHVSVVLTHWPLSGLNVIWKMSFSILLYWLVSSNLPKIISLDDCHRTFLMVSQHWFREWLGADRQHANTWTSVDQDLQRHMASLGPKKLID